MRCYYCTIAKAKICSCTIIATRRCVVAGARLPAIDQHTPPHMGVHTHSTQMHTCAHTHTHTHIVLLQITPHHNARTHTPHTHTHHTHTPHTHTHTTCTHTCKLHLQLTLSSNEKVPYKHGDKSCNLIFLAGTFICSLTYSYNQCLIYEWSCLKMGPS